MTRPEAVGALLTLARGLTADHAGVERLLERIVEHEQGEMLRDALVEVGARSILDTAAKADAFHRADPSCRRVFVKPGNDGRGRA